MSLLICYLLVSLHIRLAAKLTGKKAQRRTYSMAVPLKRSRKCLSQERALKELPGWVTRMGKGQSGESERFRFVAQDNLVLVALTGLLLHRTYQASESPLRDVLTEAGIEDLAGFSLQFDFSYASENERRDVWERLGRHATRPVRSGGKFLLVFDLADSSLTGQLIEANGGAPAFLRNVGELVGWREPRPVQSHLVP